MTETYVHRKRVKHHHHVYRFSIVMMLVILFGAALLIWNIIKDDKANQQPVQQTTADQSVITGGLQSVKNQYFSFEDYGKWVLSQQDSNSNRYVYVKYRGAVVDSQLVVYVNQTPADALLAVPKTLPVRVVDSNNLDASTVSKSCGTLYRAGQAHAVKRINIDSTTIVCDPDSILFEVIVSEIGDDFKLHLKRRNGQFASYIIIFKDLTTNPSSYTLRKIISSFKSV